MSRKVLSDKRVQKKKTDLLRDVRQLLEVGLNMVVTLYLYFTDGYARIGTDKHEFLYEVSGKVGLALVPVLLIYLLICGSEWLRDRPNEKLRKRKIAENISLTDRYALAYAVVVLLSYLFYHNLL